MSSLGTRTSSGRHSQKASPRARAKASAAATEPYLYLLYCMALNDGEPLIAAAASGPSRQYKENSCAGMRRVVLGTDSRAGSGALVSGWSTANSYPLTTQGRHRNIRAGGNWPLRDGSPATTPDPVLAGQTAVIYLLAEPKSRDFSCQPPRPNSQAHVISACRYWRPDLPVVICVAIYCGTLRMKQMLQLNGC
jgi:hypothetical protein